MLRSETKQNGSENEESEIAREKIYFRLFFEMEYFLRETKYNEWKSTELQAIFRQHQKGGEGREK